MQEKQTDIKKDILRRVRWLYVILFTAGLAIAVKIVYIQFGPSGDDLRARSVKITFERVDVEADRGDILSWDNKIMATSVPMYEIRMDFAAQGLMDTIFNKNVDSLAYCLSNFFEDRSQSTYKNMLVGARKNRTKNRYVLLSPRRVNHLEIKEISKFPIFRLGTNKGGFIAKQINKRMLPYGSMASRTIGMVNESGTKLGIEGAFDKELRGVDGNMLMQKISGSFKIPVSNDQNVEPIDGIDVVTTIDVDIQDVAQRALRQQLESGDADWGCAVLMEVATGEIRAMSNLTRKREGVYVEDFNYAVGMNLEPGSTFKLASLLALLDDAGASLDEKYETGDGVAMISRAKVVDTHGYGTITLEEVFEKSSNVGFAMAVNKYYSKTPDKFVDYLYKIGLGMPMDLQIAGEQNPVIRRPGERWWDKTTLTMMSYGYAVRLTPLKTLSLYNAVANKGKMVAPLLVTELKQYGMTLRKYPPKVMVESIASEATIKKVHRAMVFVVDYGTAAVLKNPHYKVAAKTGTAQIAQGKYGYTDRYGGRHYLATLAGYFPAKDPKYSCIVVMKTYNGPGRRNTYYGASLAGPVFRAIADRVYAQNVNWQKPVSETKKLAEELPEVKGGSAGELKRVIRDLNVPVKIERNIKDWVGIQKSDTTKSEFYQINADQRSVPSVIGMGLKEATYLLEKLGFIVYSKGVGTVTSQSIPAGANIQRGNIIHLNLGKTIISTN